MATTNPRAERASGSTAPQVLDAGVQRRRQRNTTALTDLELTVPESLKAELKANAKASGLSRSLYAALLLDQLRDAKGRLPVLNPALDFAQEAEISAA